MKRRHLHFVVASLSLLLTIAVLLLAVTYRNGKSSDTFGIEFEGNADTSQCNISAQIARDLRESNMLFIADQAEFADLSRQTVTDFLDHWSSAKGSDFENGLRGLEKITLVLQIDSTALKRANECMETWDYKDIAVPTHMHDTSFTTADLEFYWRIGNVRHRLNAAKVRDEWWKRIEFEIIPMPTLSGKGAEVDSINSNRLAQQLGAYRDSHPNEKVIAFFNAPLLYRTLPRYYGRPLFSTSIVRELEKQRGQEVRLTTLSQADRNEWPFAFLRGVPDCDFILQQSSLEQTAIKNELPPELRFDRLVLRNHPPDLHLPISSVPSMHVAKIVVASMPDLIDSSGLVVWPAMLTYLDAVSGATPLRVNVHDKTAIREACIQWQKWADTARINVVEDVSSLRIWTRLIDKIAGASNLVARHYDETLMSILPGAPAFDARFETPTKAERAAQLRGYVLRNRDKIVVRMLINVLWVGDQSEKSDALSALSRETGVRFNTAAEWSQWYRDGRPDDW